MERLIVVAEKQTVYKKFPTPLINRLEKHFLTINTMLDERQQRLAKELEDWAKEFATPGEMVQYHGYVVWAREFATPREMVQYHG